LQRPVSVLEDDTLESLAARVFKEECKGLPEAITLYAEGRLKLEGQRVRISPR
jgi:phosphoribosylglycinamide formyltransferase-1